MDGRDVPLTISWEYCVCLWKRGVRSSFGPCRCWKQTYTPLYPPEELAFSELLFLIHHVSLWTQVLEVEPHGKFRDGWNVSVTTNSTRKLNRDMTYSSSSRPMWGLKLKNQVTQGCSYVIVPCLMTPAVILRSCLFVCLFKKNSQEHFV